MGFFNFDKPGPGVDPNAPKKKGIFLYFDVLMQNIGAIIKTNFLYFFVSIPMLIVSFAAAVFFVNWVSNLLGIGNAMLKSQATMYCTFLFVVFIGSGPASAAFSRFIRAILNDEHKYIFSDFFKNMKKNFGQGLAVGIIHPLVTFIMLFCLIFYAQQYIFHPDSLMWFLFALIVGIICLIFVMSSFYIYPLMVTFENSVLELYKNALILALVKIPQNFGMMLIIGVISYLIFFALTPLASAVLALIGAVAVMRLAPELYAARVIDKNILNNAKRNDK